MEKQVSEKSTKKELWDAYQELIRAKTEDIFEEGKMGAGESAAEPGTSATVVQGLSTEHGVSSAPVVRELDTLRHRVAATLDQFGEQAASFEKRAAEEEDKLAREMQARRDAWKREQELYEYERGLKRRKEEDDYTFKLQERDRGAQERFAAKERELRERDEKLKIAEDELKQLRSETAKFPQEIERVSINAATEARRLAESAAKAAADLTGKDRERETEVAKLRIGSLEDSLKKRDLQITGLERQLAQAHEQIQKLAVTVIESGSGTRSKEVRSDIPAERAAVNGEGR